MSLDAAMFFKDDRTVPLNIIGSSVSSGCKDNVLMFVMFSKDGRTVVLNIIGTYVSSGCKDNVLMLLSPEGVVC